MTNPLQAYLKEMRDIRGTGAAVPETSYYPALSNLLNEIGKKLKPKVRCVVNIANRGAGIPDVGLFTADQIRKKDPNPMQGQLPACGVLEVKGPAAELKTVAQSEQVKRYSGKYGVVLVTNYREFLLLGRDAQGNPLPMEPYTLADSEAAFWQAATHPQKTAAEHGERFREYLARVMQSNAPLSAPQDVAWFLASYARDAKARVENHKDLSALFAIREALEEALGMEFTGEKGEHFFRSTLVQTIFYGVFSAWVLWHRERPERTDAFDWRMAEWSLRVPFIRALYEQVATPTKLGDLGLVEVLNWTTAALNRVNRAAFFKKFRDEHAVQYFYEPFLEAFDPDLRKELGVWYTPPEIVQYQVARVDTVLREELGLDDGLADPNVVVLDPCCGTGAYLVEVLRKIGDTLKAKGGDALLASDLKKAAMTRIFGFEILPAPFVVAHLQLGLMLRQLGAPLTAQGKERVGVYLTNALTGWEPVDKTKRIPFPELEAERDAARHVKRDERILVILGNPPYNAFAGVSPEEEQGLVEPYKGEYFITKLVKTKHGRRETKIRKYKLNDPLVRGGWGIKKFNLDDLYIRFFRLAERRIAEMSGKGVVSFISNFSYLGDPSFVVMRQRFLREFDKLWFDCMNGDSRETGKVTPEGDPDPSVFSTEYNRQGIRVGTAVGVMCKKGDVTGPVAQPPSAVNDMPGAEVFFRHFWGVGKRQDLLESIDTQPGAAVPHYITANPCKENRYSFRPENVSAEYNAWPKLTELAQIAAFPGLEECRGGALIDIDRAALEARMQDYFNPELSWDDYKARQTALVSVQARFNPALARRKALSAEQYDSKRVLRYVLRPFETRWCYYTGVRPVWNEPRPALWEQCAFDNGVLVSRLHCQANPEGVPFFLTRLLYDKQTISRNPGGIPLGLASSTRAKPANGQGSFLEGESEPTANLSAPAREYLSGLGITDPDADAAVAGLIWMHALAIGYSPAYLEENSDGIRRDWPRIPLPDSRKALEESAALGQQVAALLDSETDVVGVTSGDVGAIFRTIGVLTKVTRSTAEGLPAGAGDCTTQLNPDAGDLTINVGWGHAGKQGVTMPGRGQIVQRPYDLSEHESICDFAEAHGLSTEQVFALLGQDTRDVYLNEKAYWKNVPANVWDYYIGGYQVIKKWLSYREDKLLGRALKPDEAREVINMARRIAAIILLQPKLDKNYQTVADHAYGWPKS